MEVDRVRMEIRLSKHLCEKAREMAKMRELSLSAFIRVIIKEKLEKEIKK